MIEVIGVEVVNTTPLPPAPMNGLVYTSLSKYALMVVMFW
jgi:hypothetical protein